MRALLATLAAAIAAAPPLLAPTLGTDGVVSTPIALDPADHAVRKVGALTYLAGWHLRGGGRAFGGLSSMTAQGDGLVAISDAGVAFRLLPGARGIALGASRALPDLAAGIETKISRDSESSTYDAASGRTWVGFETMNAIWRYSPGLARAEAHAEPAAMADWPKNRGAEAMIRLRDGRFLVFEESGEVRADGNNVGLLFPGDPTGGAPPLIFAYRPPEDFAITDGAELPDGRVLLLHRSFTLTQGARAALTIFDPRAIAAGKVIAGREIARLAAPLTVDNMEALAVTNEGGRTIVWIASDDNFNPLQRTLLMKFALDPGT